MHSISLHFIFWRYADTGPKNLHSILEEIAIKTKTANASMDNNATVVPIEKKNFCQHCSQFFLQYRNLYTHSQTYHVAKVKRYVCYNCDPKKMFTKSCNYKDHMKTIHHDLDIPSPPPSIDIDHSEAGKLQIVSNSLILKSSHISISSHEYIFPFLFYLLVRATKRPELKNGPTSKLKAKSCPHCSKSFYQTSNLKRHIGRAHKNV